MDGVEKLHCLFVIMMLSGVFLLCLWMRLIFILVNLLVQILLPNMRWPQLVTESLERMVEPFLSKETLPPDSRPSPGTLTFSCLGTLKTLAYMTFQPTGLWNRNGKYQYSPSFLAYTEDRGIHRCS